MKQLKIDSIVTLPESITKIEFENTLTDFLVSKGWLINGVITELNEINEKGE